MALIVHVRLLGVKVKIFYNERNIFWDSFNVNDPKGRKPQQGRKLSFETWLVRNIFDRLPRF
jgi:hypothetical protein